MTAYDTLRRAATVALCCALTAACIPTVRDPSVSAQVTDKAHVDDRYRMRVCLLEGRANDQMTDRCSWITTDQITWDSHDVGDTYGVHGRTFRDRPAEETAHALLNEEPTHE